MTLALAIISMMGLDGIIGITWETKKDTYIGHLPSDTVVSKKPP